ncbi:TNF receptor-associated factor 4-like isoform X1 [Oculina patagonica]
MAEAPANQLPSGYDEEFVNAVEEDFQCLICHLPLKEPVLTRCGHRFCKDCLEEHFRRQGVQNQPLTCPADREGLDQRQDVFPDKATERKILSLAIKCPSTGCNWTGELRNKEDHLASCLFNLVSCTNENCHVTLKRRYLENHVMITCQWRILECDHCSEPHPECKMKDHTAQCRKFPVSCPNNCGGLFPREMIPNHTGDDCPLMIISCPYVKMGCETKIQRKQVESHLQSAMRFHLDLACVKLNDAEEKLECLQRRLEEKISNNQGNTTEEKIVMVKNVFVWKINDFKEILRKARSEENIRIGSAPFYTESYGYKMKVEIYPNGQSSGKNTHLSVFIYVMKGEYDAILPWPFKKKVKITLIDQQEDLVERQNDTGQLFLGNYPQCSTRPMKEANISTGFPAFISHKKLYSRRYLVDDTVFLQVEVGPSSS